MTEVIRSKIVIIIPRHQTKSCNVAGRQRLQNKLAYLWGNRNYGGWGNHGGNAGVDDQMVEKKEDGVRVEEETGMLTGRVPSELQLCG